LSIKDDLSRLILALARKVEAMDPPATAPLPEPPEPEPPRKAGPPQGSQAWFRQLKPYVHEGAVEMNDLLRAANRARRSRRLPRTPEEARRRF
jgi:hypothetical protein